MREHNITTNRISLKKHLRKGMVFGTPLALLCSVALSLAYITDIAKAGTAEAGIGETTQVAGFLYEIGNIVARLIFPLISGGIAMSIGGLWALPAGILSGMLTSIGSTLIFPSGDSFGISGVIGCIVAGVVAGTTAVIIKKRTLKSKSNIRYLWDMMLPIVPIITSAVVALGVNQTAYFLNILLSTGLGALSRVSILLTALGIGIMMTADGAGALYLSAYTFGAASLATGEAGLMACVMAAGMVPPLSIGLCAAVFSENFTKKERLSALIAMGCGIFGVFQGAIPFYCAKPLKIIPPCIAGGMAASVLCIMLRCSVIIPVGGVLSLIGTDRPLYFLLSVLFGVFLSTSLLALSLSTETEKKNKTKIIPTAQSAAA